MKKVMALAVAFFTAYQAFACNAPTSASVSTTALTCRGSGTVSVSALMDGAQPLTISDCSFALYNATNNVLVKPFQSSPVITGLDAGTYTLRIHQNCAPSGVSADYTQTVTITGSYTDPVLGVPVITAPTCSNDGIITAMATQGYGAYEFCLVDSLNAPAAPASYVRPRQASATFNSLAPGVYFVRVYDQCNGFVTTKVTMPAGIPPTDPFGTISKNGEDCNRFRLDASFTRDIPREPYTLWWRYPDGTYDTLKTATYPGRTFGWYVPKSKISSYPGVVTLFFKNECGTVFTKDITLNQPNWQINGRFATMPYTCTQGSYTMNAAYWQDLNNGNTGGPLNGYWDEYSLDGGLTWIPYNASDTILIDRGASKDILYKVCGQVYSATISTPAALRILNPEVHTASNASCNGNGSIYMSVSDYSGPRYNGALSKLLVHVVSQPAAQPLIPDFYYSDRPRALTNLAPGAYTLLFTDECGATATRNITVVASVQTFEAVPAYACGSPKVSVKITFNTTGGAGDNINYKILNSSNVQVAIGGAYLGGIGVPWSKTITNLDPGVYTVRMWRSDVSNNVLSLDTICPQILTVDARMPGPLSLSKSIFAICTNDPATGIITAMPQGGVPPYTYTLFKGSIGVGNQVGAPQGSNVFTNLDVNENYVISVTDQCGAGSTYSNVFASLRPFIATSTPLVPCPGEPITLSVSKNTGLFYQWTLNGTNIPGATDTAYAIGAVTMADSGVYQVKITANSCVLYSREMAINPAICGIVISLPIDLVSFTGRVNANGNATLNWTIAAPEPGGKFDVLYSTNGKSYMLAGTVYQQGSKTNFDFTHTGHVIHGKAFYKLLMTEANGTVKHSNVLPLSNGGAMGAETNLSAAPVPFNNTLTVRYTAHHTGPVQITIVDVSGRIVVAQSYEATAGSNAVTLNGLCALPAGLYMLGVSNETGEKQTIKIAK